MEDKGFWTEWEEQYNNTMANCKNRHKQYKLHKQANKHNTNN